MNSWSGTAKIHLLGVFLIICLWAPNQALADCVAQNGSALNNLATSESVNCTGSATTPLANAAAATDIVVKLVPGSALTTTVDTISLGDDSVVSIDGATLGSTGATSKALSLGNQGYAIILNSSLSVAGNAEVLNFLDDNIVFISESTLQGLSQNITGGDGNTLSIAGSKIITTLAGAEAIQLGNNSFLSLSDSSISQQGNASVAISVDDNTSVGLHNTAIEIQGNGAIGIKAGAGYVQLFDSTITLDGTGGTGIQIGNNGIVSTNNSSITAESGIVGNTGVNQVSIEKTSIIATGKSLYLDAGNDILYLADGSNLASTSGADAGAGNDWLRLFGSNAEDEVFMNFESLTMEGVDWALSGESVFQDGEVQKGRLRINGKIEVTNGLNVEPSGIIGGNGNLTASTLSVSGGTAPGNSVGTLIVTGNYLQNGGFFEAEYDQTGLDLLAVTGTATLTGSPTLVVKPLSGVGGAAGTFLLANGGLTGTFGEIDFQGNGGATVIYDANSAKLIAAQPTGLVAEDAMVLGQGERVLSMLGSEQLAHLGNPKRQLWGTGLGQFGERQAQNGNAGYDYETSGAMVGSDLYADETWHLGLGAGYNDTSIDIEKLAGDSDLTGAIGLAYGSYEHGRLFVLGRVMGGWQDIDATRSIASGGPVTLITLPTVPATIAANGASIDEAQGDSGAWLFGSGLSFGANVPLNDGWSIQPRVNLDYVRQWHDGVRESGGGDGGIDVDGFSTAALTASGQFRIGRNMDFDAVMFKPYVDLGVAQRIALGDRHADAEFQETGDDFDVALDNEDRTMALINVGAIVDFKNGVTAELGYGGQLTGDGDQHGVMATIRASW